MDGRRAQAINHALGTAKRRELFDAMLTEVAAGRWEELEPDGRSLYTIRWRVTRKVVDVYRTGYAPVTDQTWDELVFVRLMVGGIPGLGHCGGPWSGRQDSDLTLTKALAVVRDPVTALGLDPVPVLRWGLVWSDGTAEPGPRFAGEAETAPDGQENVVPGHAARHASCDGTVALDAKLNPVSCRACGATEIRGRDVVFHPWTAELFEEVPVASS
jgi:hypothetical protein